MATPELMSLQKPYGGPLRRMLIISALLLSSCVIAWTSVAFHPLVALVIVVAMAGVAVGVMRPFLLLLLFIVVLLTRPADYFPALAVLKPAKIIGLLALSTWLLSKLIRRDWTWVRTQHDPWILLLTAAVLLSCAFSANRSVSFGVFTDAFVKILLLYVLIVNTVNHPRRMVQFLLIIGLATVFLAAYVCWAKATQFDLVEGSRTRFVGLLEDPNDLALVLLMAIPFLFCAGLRNLGWTRVGYFSAFGIIIAGILTTQSRGGLLALMLAFIIIMRSRIKSRAALVGLSAVLIGGLIFAAGLDKRESGSVQIGNLEMDESAQDRLDTWKAGLRMFADHPVTGVGLQMFPEFHFDYADNRLVWTNLDAHNSYVQVAAESGLLGIIGLLGLVWSSLKNASRFRFSKRAETLSPSERAALESMLPALAAVLTAAFFLSQGWMWFIYIMMALGAAIPNAFGHVLSTPQSS